MSEEDPTVADRAAAAAGSSPAPGHPATPDRALPSAGEQLSRGGDDLPVVGDDVVLAEQQPES